jgi:peptidoglycan/LPS O-acetylase OafA/YrhL
MLAARAERPKTSEPPDEIHAAQVAPDRHSGAMRFPQLDSLRALAIGAVMFEHYAGERLNNYFPLGAGFTGVGCFFALSGFLITSTLLYELDHEPGGKTSAWLKFYGRRVLRLFPAYYGCILILVLLNVEPVVSSWPWHAAYLSNVWVAMGNPILDFWSLAVEEQFYALWPFVIAFTPRRHLPAVIIATTVVLSLVIKASLDGMGVSYKSVQTLLFAKTPELGLGALLALISYRAGRPGDMSWCKGVVARRFTILAWTSLAIAVLGWAVYGTGGWFRYYLNDLLSGIFFIWVIAQLAIGVKGPLGALLSHPAPQYVGHISYGLYLVHNWVPKILEQYFGEIPKLLAAPIVLAVTFGICALSWQFYEKPILGLKRYIGGARRPFTTRSEPSAAVPLAGSGSAGLAPRSSAAPTSS